MPRCYSFRRLSYVVLVFLAYKVFTWALLLHEDTQHDTAGTIVIKPVNMMTSHGFLQSLDNQDGVNQRDTPEEPLRPPAQVEADPVAPQQIGKAEFAEGHPKMVLLLSYQRSGSTYIGNVVLMNNPDVYYVYEPLDGPYCAMYGTQPGMNIPDDIHNYENGSHREMPAHEMELMRQTMLNIYHCDTKKSPLQMSLHKFWDFFSYNMDKIRPYAKCLKRKRMSYKSVERCRGHIRSLCGKRFSASNSTDNACLQRLWLRKTAPEAEVEDRFLKYESCMKKIAKRLGECIAMPDKVCANNNIRAMKTVRATFETIRPFFRDVPNFRVIHLIRDPRAAVASKRKLWWAQGIYASENISREAAIYCQGITRDLALRKELEQKYPGQIMEVVYDDFVMRPEANLHRLYDFLDLKLHKETVKKFWTASVNSTHAATKWQTLLTYHEAKLVQQECQGVYNGVTFDQWT